MFRYVDIGAAVRHAGCPFPSLHPHHTHRLVAHDRKLPALAAELDILARRVPSAVSTTQKHKLEALGHRECVR